MRTISDLISSLQKIATNDGIYSTHVPNVTVINCSAPTAPELVLYRPALCIVAQGTKEVLLGDRSFRYNSANYLLGSARLPVTGAVLQASPDKPYLCLRVDLDPLLLSELIENTNICNTDKRVSEGLLLGEMDSSLIDTAARIAELHDNEQDSAVLGPLWVRELIWRVLRQPQSYSVLCQMIMAGSQLLRITHAMKWIEAHFTEPISVDQLAEIANMSPSSFYQHFKIITGTSPLSYRRRLRLMKARRFMVAEGCGAAEAGFRVGYNEPAQFSREYTKQFGLPPKQDSQRIREGAYVEVY